MSKPNLLDRYATARRTLEAAGHEHALKFFHDLDPDDQDALLEQIEGVDWPEVARLIETHVRTKPVFKLPENVQPAPWYPYSPPPELKAKYQQARKLGEDLIRAGKVAAFTVAGGQGTRLGWDGPKGSFPATPIRGLSLFGCMAEFILKTQKKYAAKVPWYIMTSPTNDGDTRAYFEEHHYFGLASADVMMFPQGMMPAIAPAPGTKTGGHVLLEAPHSLALSPNGHGGSLKALFTSGAIANMKSRGIQEISYTQVDNPIVKVIDPLFLGLHAMDRCEMSSKMLPKREPLEKLGNFCLVDGKMTVIEYSDLPESLAHERLPGGELRFKAGSIAIHAIRVDFVESLNSSAGFGLPFHRADKKVPCLDPHTGEPVEPTKPNAVKLETFVFDALPLTERSIIYETDRIEEFAPIKNADGANAVDCPATSKEIQIERAARWMEKSGVKVPRDSAGKVDAVIEISHLTAVEAEDLKDANLPSPIKPNSHVLL